MTVSEVTPQSASVMPPKKVHIETWGCQMNAADSERMLAILAEKNYALTHSPDDADLVLLNTCHIREKAKHKVLSRLGILRELKRDRPGMKIAVAGCVAQAEGRRLLKSAPQIDILLGPGKIEELPRLLEEHQVSGQSSIATGFARRHHHDDDQLETGASRVDVPVEVQAPPTLSGKKEVSRYVNIQQGCNNYCTFCVVPFTRGREISRTISDIVSESKALLVSGAREITLLGQNVNSYGSDHGETTRFVDLLREVASLPDLARLRFTTSNPHDFTPALAELFAQEPKLGGYIHLPVQSGSDRILQRMQRKVTAAEYLERVSWLKAARPDIAISTDLIVGFPGETEEDFAATLDLVEKVRFSFSFTFKYSPRNNTPAARYLDQVPEDVKEERLARLNSLQNRISTELNTAEIGASRQVLFLYESQKLPGFYYGRTDHFRLVRVAAERCLTGEIANVQITDANKTALLGNLI